jgi:endothelin-converting enzyme
VVCGGYQDKHQITPENITASTIDDTLALNIGVYKDILESPFSALNLTSASSSVDQQNLETLQLYYESCMNETALDQIGVAPLQDTIAQLMALWPLIHDDYNQDTNVTEADIDPIAKSVAFLEQLHIEPFQKYDIFINDKQPVSTRSQIVTSNELMPLSGPTDSTLVSHLGHHRHSW